LAKVVFETYFRIPKICKNKTLLRQL